MKLNSENYEWMMIELLEGNLSEHDELSVMKQIEEDEFYFKQWKWYKHSKVEPDNTLFFPNKERLLKPAIARTQFRGFMTYGIAASIAFAICIGIFWPTKVSDKEFVQTVQNNDNQIIENLEMKLDKSIPKEVFVQKVSSSITEQQVPKQRKKRGNFIQYIPTGEENMDTISEIYEIVVESEKKHLVLNSPDTTDYFVVQNTETKAISTSNSVVVQSSSTPIVKKITAFVTNQPIRRIRNKTKTIVQKMKSPNLKISPKFEGRNSTLDIQFESDGYIAMANFQPFKNKN